MRKTNTFFKIAGFLLAWLLLVDSSCAPSTTPDITVAPDGSGDFTSIQAAIDAVPANNDRRTVIYIKRGLYAAEKLIVPANKTNISLVGESREETIISYHLYDCASSGKCPPADAAQWSGENIRTSATLTILGGGFHAENLTIQNTAGPVGQAQAVTVRADRVIFRNCDLKGYQDTIYLWDAGKRTYFEGCLIIGRTDYIYGAGIAFFQSCEIRSWGGGWITAPATPRNQPYGFVFHQCAITYADNSPRSGDDGATVALGRPWHEYPKVAWLYCDMTEKIDPLGWPTKWNMDYADTNPDLHLYEYQNTGPGADMTRRADWAGIRALTDAEAANYTVQKVMGDWDPTAETPAVTVFQWTGEDESNSWLSPGNWDPMDQPGAGEAAVADSAYLLSADGGAFEADLLLTGGAILNVTENSDVTYLSIGVGTIRTDLETTLYGRVHTRDTAILKAIGSLTLNARLTGIHEVIKKGDGQVVLQSDNTGFSGIWILDEGRLEAAAANSLGYARGVYLSPGVTLTVSNDHAFYPQSPLYVVTGSVLELNSAITLSEFYIDGILQPVGAYSATTHPELIRGAGHLFVGRPSSFTFIGGDNGNWDNPEHFQPALLPLAGETVYVDREIETTPYVFTADLVVTGSGNVRLRGGHAATGTITLQTGARLTYATSGPGFSLNAPIVLEGDISLSMNSRNTAGHSMTLSGSITGASSITPYNTRSDVANTATLVLLGDNSDFSGVWDITRPGGHPQSIIAVDGQSAHAFGRGQIEVDNGNRAIFSHADCAGPDLSLALSGDGKAVLNTELILTSFYLNGIRQSDGVYSAQTHPDWFEGVGSITVGDGTTGVGSLIQESPVWYANRRVYISGLRSLVSIYRSDGVEQIGRSTAKEISLEDLAPGIYFVRYLVDRKQGVLKIGLF